MSAYMSALSAAMRDLAAHGKRFSMRSRSTFRLFGGGKFGCGVTGVGLLGVGAGVGVGSGRGTMGGLGGVAGSGEGGTNGSGSYWRRRVETAWECF